MAEEQGNQPATSAPQLDHSRGIPQGLADMLDASMLSNAQVRQVKDCIHGKDRILSEAVAYAVKLEEQLKDLKTKCQRTIQENQENDRKIAELERHIADLESDNAQITGQALEYRRENADLRSDLVNMRATMRD